jgi:hypothetical protein
VKWIRLVIYLLGLAGFPVRKELRIMSDALHITVGKRRAFKAVKEQSLAGVVTTIPREGKLDWAADPPEAISIETHPTDPDSILAKGLAVGVVTITAQVDGLSASVGQEIVPAGGGGPVEPPAATFSLRIEISPEETE